MIVVIADDFTGAAEIGGIGLRYGLKVLLSNDVNVPTDTDLLVIYTNTRSLTENKAVTEMRLLTQKVVKLNPSLIYKKTDSVLRGHVLAEMNAQMEALGFKKALLIPENPLLGRTIQKGTYYINGKPVNEAGFANDPEFPISNSTIESMLGAFDGEVHLRTFSDNLPEGITVGEASTMKEIRQWALVTDANIFYAGAASFFGALLHQRFVAKMVETNLVLSNHLLLVSGTMYQQSIKKQSVFQKHVCSMPAELFRQENFDSNEMEKWVTEVKQCLFKTGKCIMAIGQQSAPNADPELLRKKLSAAVVQVINTTAVKELLVEGGATSFAIIQGLGLTTFAPTKELQQGVVRMKVIGKDDLYLTIKPGSYVWPDTWNKAFE